MWCVLKCIDVINVLNVFYSKHFLTFVNVFSNVFIYNKRHTRQPILRYLKKATKQRLIKYFIGLLMPL